MIHRPLIRYHGAKFKLSKWITSHFPPHDVYVDVFGGGGAVLLNKERCRAEIYNDLWSEIVNVFRVIRDPASAQELARRIHLTPFSREEFALCTPEKYMQTNDPIEKAWMTIYRSFAGFGSAAANLSHLTGFRGKSLRTSSASPAMDWANYPFHMAAFCERLRGVTIENIDFRALIPKHSSQSTLLYIDPPYKHDTRKFRSNSIPYVHEMTDQDHIELLELLTSTESKVILSGHDNELYNSRLAGWTKVCRQHKIDSNAFRTECIWINPAAGGTGK